MASPFRDVLLCNAYRPNKPVINRDFDVPDTVNDLCLTDGCLLDQLAQHHPVKLLDIGIARRRNARVSS